MNTWQKSSLFLTLAVSILGLGQVTKAADCPLLPQTPYKAPGNPDVYYINRSCTKRLFTNETAFFAYFSSWKEVRTISSNTLSAIPMDPRGPVQYRIVDPAPQPTRTADVVAEFLNCPTQSERTKIEQDFNLVWGNEWAAHPFNCDYRNGNPSRVPTYNTLRFIKNIEYQKPLPFTNGNSLYNYLTNTKLTITTLQDCSHTLSGRAHYVTLGGVWAYMDPIFSGSDTGCSHAKGLSETVDGFVYSPIHKAGPFMFAAEAAMRGHQPYTSEMDGDINHSIWAKPFYFYAWTYLYSTNVPTKYKEMAKNSAIQTIEDRFVSNKCPSEPELKAIVNKIIPNTCK